MGILGSLFRTRLYSVMNDDHAQMFDILAELRRVVTGRLPEETDAAHHRRVEEMVRRLVDASVVHFFREEALMKACHYPETARHRSDHLLLIRSVQTFQASAFRQGRPISEDIVRYLHGWVVDHINGSDRKLDAYLRSYSGPINDAALSGVEWKALSPQSVNLSSKGLSLWANLNFFKSARPAAARDAAASAAQDEIAGQRLTRMGAPRAEISVGEKKRRYEDSVRAYNGYYYGNY